LTVDAVNRARVTEDGAAGKAVNVAKVLKLLGAEPVAMGVLGGDRGAKIRSILNQRGIQTEFLEVAAATRECITVIDDESGTHTELVEESKPVNAVAYHGLIEAAASRVKSSRAVVMSGTLTPGGPVDFYFRCAQLANQAGVLTVIDAHGEPLEAALKAAPTVVKPNRVELASMLQRELRTEAEVIGAMRELQQMGARQIVVTAGKEPTLAFDGQVFWRITSPVIKPVNPTGSGDAFSAGLTWRLTQGEMLSDACRWAAACGAANALTLMPGDLNPHGLTQLAQDVRIQEIA
jgi:1-phosphofructokinase family hexose kinase